LGGKANPAVAAKLRPVPDTFFTRLARAVDRAGDALLRLQHPEGYWWAELESNVSITAEYVMLHRFLGLDGSKIPRMAADILNRQLPNGGWSIWYGDGGELSATVEAYFALKLAGLSPEDEPMVRARNFILARGGALKTRVFTRIFLALFGQVCWDGIPLLPVEFMLIPPWSGLSIYEFSSWTRATVVPLMIIMAHRPVRFIPPEQGVAELFLDPEEPFEKHRVTWGADKSLLENAFAVLDRILKLYQRVAVPFVRRLALAKAEKWVLEHEEETGDWAGIQPAMLNSILALSCQGYGVNSDPVRRGLKALEFFTLEENGRLRLQSCISPVWDTALAVRALAAAGLPPGHPALEKAGAWLLSMQILKPGDWSIKAPHLPPGGWAFEFVNNWYPDLDDTSVVVAALKEALADPEAHRRALELGLNWCLGMQSKNGGFASFDKDNTKVWLNAIPFGDLKALVDPPTEDITARVLEMMGIMGYGPDHPAAVRGLEFIRRTQQPDGSWWGRWGVNCIYGTWSVLAGLKAIGEDMGQPYVHRAARWLKAHQNPDGGWGECCECYPHKEMEGCGPTTASQTAWALLGLMAAGEALAPEVRSGIEYLVNHQNDEGRWDEEQFTGTGFPGHFMIRYHLYRDVFPLWALGQYLKASGQ